MPEALPQITVITPTRNRRRLLEETVASVLAQTLERWELIVVDDVSEDDTWAWLRSLDDPRIEPVRVERRVERTAARNLGLRSARGRYVLFLDDDDLLVESALGHHVAMLDRHSRAVASVGARTMFGEAITEHTVGTVRRETVRDIWGEVLLGWVAVSGVTAFRTDAVRMAGAWDESYVIAEDYELWGRIARVGPVVLSPDVMLRYRVHSGQWRSSNVPQLMAEMRKKAVERAEGPERRHGERVLEARSLIAMAGEQVAGDEPAKAIRSYLKAVALVPRLLRSPLVPAIVTLPQISLVRIIHLQT